MESIGNYILTFLAGMIIGGALCGYFAYRLGKRSSMMNMISEASVFVGKNVQKYMKQGLNKIRKK